MKLLPAVNVEWMGLRIEVVCLVKEAIIGYKSPLNPCRYHVLGGGRDLLYY